MTITVTPEPTFEPPRMRIDLEVPTGTMQSLSLYRTIGSRRELVSPQPAAGLDARTVFDYFVPFETDVTYSWETLYTDPSLTVMVNDENWASTADWSGGAFWFVNGGFLRSNSSIPLPTNELSYDLSANPGRYRVTFDAPPVGLGRVDLGPVQVNFTTSQIVAGSATTPFAVGTGEVRIEVAETSVSVVTTAGSYSLPVAVAATKVSLIGVVPTMPAPASFVSNGGGYNDVAIDATGGYVYVTRGASNTVEKYNLSGTLITSWGSAGTGNGQFNNPWGIDIDSAGNLYVVDSGNHRVQKFAPPAVATNPHTYSTKWGTLGTGNGQFNRPRGIAVDAADKPTVVDGLNRRLQRFSTAGVYEAQTGSRGEGNGQFLLPDSIEYSSATGRFFVTDRQRNIVQRFSGALVYEARFGSTGTGPGQLQLPRGISAMANALYVADANKLQRFTEDGGFIDSVPLQPGLTEGIDSKVSSSTPYVFIATFGGTPSVQQVLPVGTRVAPLSIERFGVSDLFLEETADPESLEPDRAWLVQPQNPALSFPLERRNGRAAGIVAADAVGQRANSTVHQIVGQSRAVTVTSGPRGADEFLLTVATETSAERTSLEACLRDQIPLLLQVPPSWDVEIPYGFFHVADVSIGRRVQMPDSPGRLFSLPLTAVDAPLVAQANVGWSWAALAAEFGTWAQVAEAFESWADVLVNNRRDGF